MLPSRRKGDEPTKPYVLVTLSLLGYTFKNFTHCYVTNSARPAPCPPPPASFSPAWPLPCDIALPTVYVGQWGRMGEGSDPYLKDLGLSFKNSSIATWAKMFVPYSQCPVTACSVCPSISAVCTGRCVYSTWKRGHELQSLGSPGREVPDSGLLPTSSNRQDHVLPPNPVIGPEDLRSGLGSS